MAFIRDLDALPNTAENLETVANDPTDTTKSYKVTQMKVGTAAPTTTPEFVGQFFLDKTNDKLYVATGTSGSGDWIILN